MSNLEAGAASLRTATSMEDLRGVCGGEFGGAFFLMLGKEGLIFPLPFHTSCHEAAVKRPPDAALRP